MSGRGKDPGFPYWDIIDLPAPVSKKHAPMKRADRAAQFAPFAALTGFDDSIKETARLTDSRPELSKDAKDALDMKFMRLLSCIGTKPVIKVTWFCRDGIKKGGSVKTASAAADKININEKILILAGGTRIGIDDILELEGSLFKDLEP